MPRSSTKVLLVEQRREDRKWTNLIGAVRWERGAPISVSIEDISTSGLRLHAARPIPEGAALRIGLPNGNAPYARVVWSKGKQLGCAFETPLGESELAMLMPSIRRRPA